ncbi:MAG TPA: CPBP family glutamic-type intramembrane protease [Chloroflexia bacterium]|nr:CPBP family glutamic-type intramembrane protease [Chloroflexia bacterium]
MKLIVQSMPRLLPGAIPPVEILLNPHPGNKILNVGRHPDNHIILPDKTVSRFHLELECGHASALVVRNLSKTQNTRLNGRWLEQHERALLYPGDCLELGDVVLEAAAVAGAAETGLNINSGDHLPLSAGKLNALPEVSTPVIEKVETRDRVEAAREPGPLATASEAGRITASRVEPAHGPAWEILLPDPVWLPWVCLAALTLAEILTNLTSFQLGLLLHTVLLLWLLWYGALRQRMPGGRLSLALCTAPLIRLLSLSLPLADFPQLFWYPLVAVPLLVAVFLTCRQLRLSLKTLGLQPGNLLIQLMLAGGGFGLGALEYAILRPTPLLNDVTVLNVLIAALVLILFTGFNEEIIFRSLLQATALPLLKRWALVYVSLVFAVLHIGYKSVLDVIFVFAVGLVFAYIVMWGGSIAGVTIAHGLTNLMLFAILPNLNSPAAALSGLDELIPWLIGLGSASFLGAMLWLGWRATRRSEFLVPQAALREPDFDSAMLESGPKKSSLENINVAEESV